jgi:hypothetical protein
VTRRRPASRRGSAGGRPDQLRGTVRGDGRRSRRRASLAVVQLRPSPGLPGSGDVDRMAKLPGRRCSASWARRTASRSRARASRHADRLGGDLGLGQAGHRARLGHRRHPQAVAEARRRLPRPDRRRRARPRRRAQLRPGREHRRRARREGTSWSARKLPGTIVIWPGVAEELVARQGVPRPRGCSRTSTSSVLARQLERPGRVVGRGERHGPRVGRVHVPGAERAQRRRAVARAQRARRGRADERRLELPPRAPAHPAAVALRHRDGGDQPNVVPRPRRSGTTSARSTTRASRRSGRSATRSRGRRDDDGTSSRARACSAAAWPRHFNKAWPRR